MNIWIVAPNPLQEKLIAPLREVRYRVFCNETVAAALEAVPASIDKLDAFVLSGLSPAEARAGLKAIRAHAKLAGAPVLVVDEGLDAESASSLKAAGADFCYRQPFVAPVFTARVRAAAALKR